MKNGLCTAGLLAAGLSSIWLAPALLAAQNEAPTTAPDREGALALEYKPPPRGAPGGRVGGACRGTVKVTAPLPTIELLAPDANAGLTTTATPTLYFFVSRPVYWTTQFTISAQSVPKPVIEVTIPAPAEAGIYELRTADYNIRLETGVLYTWSISVILDPKARSHDIVASASLLRTTPDPAVENAMRGAPASWRVPLLAQAGLWYDAVAAAAEIEAFDRHFALDTLMKQVGLVEPARYDRERAQGIGLR
ncbi:MAG: DUF928 domain-containing protein [Stellaceae bacterium]